MAISKNIIADWLEWALKAQQTKKESVERRLKHMQEGLALGQKELDKIDFKIDELEILIKELKQDS